MEKENFETKNPELIFPEGSGLVIEEILEKYGFNSADAKEIDKIMDSMLGINRISPEEKIKILENLAGTKIARLLKEYADGNISLESIPLRLEKELNITKKDAAQMTEELKERIFVFIKPIKKIEVPFTEIPQTKTEIPTFPTVKPRISPDKKDTYREPIE